MDAEAQHRYLQLASDQPGILCRQVPFEILEAASNQDEPSSFLERFFATGYTQWHRETHGKGVPEELVNNAILVLWLRACRMHTNQLLGARDEDADKPFFSDEGLY